MLIKNKFLPYLIVLGAVAMGSCTKKLNTNTNDPNGLSLSQLTGKNIFGGAIVATVTNNSGGNLSTGSDNYDYATQWMGFWARNSSWASSGSQLQMETFTLNTSFSTPIWQSLYHNIYDYTWVISNSSPNSVLPGAARIMRAMVFQDLVDQFGNIPYSQAVQAPAILFPKYDSAIAIYRDLILQIDTAITSLQASQATSDDAYDVMFHGDKNLWTKFGNTIKLRILLRQVPFGDPAYVSTQMGRIVAQGSGFLGAGQDALVQPGFADAPLKQNPFWGVYGFLVGGGAYYQNYNFFCANNYALNYLTSVNDPRLGLIYRQNSKGGYNGNDFGATNTASSLTSPIGTGILKSASMPAWLFLASQSLFMQAEAAQRGLLPGSPGSLYQQGVEESFRYLGVPNAITAADQFIATATDPTVNFLLSTNKLNTILTQKWIAEDGLAGFEAYCDYRRTGIPVNPAAALGIGAMPVRLLYPQSEYLQNKDNVNTQNQANDQNAQFEPLFWAH